MKCSFSTWQRSRRDEINSPVKSFFFERSRFFAFFVSLSRNSWWIKWKRDRKGWKDRSETHSLRIDCLGGKKLYKLHPIQLIFILFFLSTSSASSLLRLILEPTIWFHANNADINIHSWIARVPFSIRRPRDSFFERIHTRSCDEPIQCSGSVSTRMLRCESGRRHGRAESERTEWLEDAMELRIGKIPGIIFSESKYHGKYPRYSLEVNTFVQGALGIIPMPEYLPQ